MAAPAYTSNLVSIYSGAGSTSGFSALGGGSSGLNAETDYFIQGTGMTSKNAFSNSTKGILYDNGSGVTIVSNGAMFLWVTHQTSNSLDTIANGGLQIVIGSGSNAFKQFYIGGKDTIIYDDRWLCIPVDPSLAASLQTGSPTTTRRYFGVQSKMVGGPSKGSPLGLDAMRHGRGYDYTLGDLANGYATFLGAATKNDLIANRYGLIQLTGATYKLQGLHKLGTSGTAVDFRDSNRNINIANTLFVQAVFNGFEVNNAGSKVEWNNITVTALGTVSRGNFIVNSNADVDLISCTFVEMNNFTFLANSLIDGSTFRKCNLITLGSGTLTGSVVANSRSSASVLAASLDSITSNTFTSDGSNHAVELSSIGGGTMSWDNKLVGYEAGGAGGSPVTPTSTGNEAIYVNVGSGTLTINVVDGATTPSIRSAGAAVNVVAGLKTFEFTLNPAITAYEWRIYTVTALGSLSGAVEIAGEELSTVSTQSYSYAYSSDVFIAVQVLTQPTQDYIEEVLYFTLKDANQSVAINLQIDNNNRFPEAPQPSSGGSVTKQIASSTDDAYQSAAGTMALTGNLIIGNNGAVQNSGFRFIGLNIPVGATITKAEMQLESSAADSSAASFLINGQKGSDPATFTSTANNLSGRTVTTANQAWSPTTWSINENGPDTLTPDFSSVLQEIIDDGAYASTHAVVIFIKQVVGFAQRRPKGYDTLPSTSAEITIEWT